MFKLRNTDNNIELELSVTGYQFPDNTNDNWCLVSSLVKQGENQYTVIDPALETTELQRMLEWFKKLSDYQLPNFGTLSFTEPCLEFEFLACDIDSVKISIKLDHEMKPDFELNQFGMAFDDWSVVFDLRADDFLLIIEGIETVLKQYPIRGQS